MCLAKRLCGGLLLQEAVFVQLGEDVLCNVGLLLCGCTSKVVKGDVEPLVDVAVKRKVLIAKLLRGALFFNRLGLGRRSIFVCTAYIECIVSSRARETGEDVGGEYGPDNVAKMGHVVDVGQSASDEHIALSLDGEDLLCCLSHGRLCTLAVLA